MLRSTVVLTALGITLLSTSSARAEGLIEPGIGLMGGYGYGFIAKPDHREQHPWYPGFAGPTSSFGVALDLRVIKFVGLEVDILKSHYTGSGDFELNGKKVGETKISHDATNIPILLKGVFPSPLLAPYAFVGIELVKVSSPSAEFVPEPGVTLSQRFITGGYADDYQFYTFGVGAEVKLPLPGVDLRVPISIRGSARSVSSESSDRVKPDGKDFKIQTEFQYRLTANVGVQYYF